MVVPLRVVGVVAGHNLGLSNDYGVGCLSLFEAQWLALYAAMDFEEDDQRRSTLENIPKRDILFSNSR